MTKLWKTNTFIFFLLISHISLSYNSDAMSSLIEVEQFKSNGAIEGKMEINGEPYKAICDCNPVTPNTKPAQDPTEPICDPSKLKIHLEKKGTGANFDDLRHLINNIEDLSYVSVPYTSFKCLDGRNRSGVLATPGGDAGEFILALSVYEDLIGGGRKLTQDNVDTFLSQFLINMPHNTFYMCSDDQAVAHIEKELSIEGLNIKNPRAQLIPDLHKSITKPENVGDLHLRMMLKYPEQFSIRRELVEMFIISYYKILWNKDSDLSTKLELEILSGDHNESAFVEVRSEHACQVKQLAPLIATKDKVISIFVNHLDACSIKRGKIAEFFSDKVNHHMDPVDKTKMHSRLNHHGFIALEITGSYVAKNLPFYTISIA